MKTYLGNAKHVLVNDEGNERLLPRRVDLANHSPDGFQWGYTGSGPAQLALAILADYTGSDDFALKHYQEFKERVIARLPMGQPFELTGTDIMAFVAEKRQGHLSWNDGDLDFS